MDTEAPNPETPGPRLQNLIGQIGVAQEEDLKTDALWLANAPVEDMTPDEVAELEQQLAEYDTQTDPYAAASFDPVFEDT